jgi:hypothetical protein
MYIYHHSQDAYTAKANKAIEHQANTKLEFI